MHANFIALALLTTSVVATQNILLSNDDGWATAQARAQYSSLVAAGFDVVLSAPAIAHSRTGSTSQTPTVLKTACQFNTCPKGSPAEGSDPNDPRLNYVNGYGPDAVEYGIDTLSPEFFGGAPDIVVSGPNVGAGLNGSSLDTASNFQVAVKAVQMGVPAVAFATAAGADATKPVSYTTLTTDPDSPATLAALLYADLATLFTQTLYNTGSPYLLPNQVLAVDFPSIAGCPNISDYKFVLAKFATDQIETVQTCGRTELSLASDVVARTDCSASVTLVNATALKDVGAKDQQAFLNKMESILSC